MEFELVLRGGQVLSEQGAARADVGIADGKIAAVEQNLPASNREIDTSGCFVAPGGIDVHTHFDLAVDGFAGKMADDYESGTRAAAAGGLTTVVSFAFQRPGESLGNALRRELDLARNRAHIDYGLHLGITDLGVAGTLEEMLELADAGFASVKILTATSYELAPPDVLRVLRAARDGGILVSVHAEDGPLIRSMTHDLLAAGKSGVRYFPHSRPATAESIATATVSGYGRALAAPVYFVHISSKAALQAITMNRDLGGEIYVETRPAYLFLDDAKYDLVESEAAKYVCTPPLRSPDDSVALWEAVGDSSIQALASDHSPWLSGQKSTTSFADIPPGMSSVQTELGLLFAEGVLTSRISTARFVSVTSAGPAKLFGMFPAKGVIAPGSDADLVVLDPEARMRIRASSLESKADYDPFEGRQVTGWPVLTMSRGEVIYRHGRVVSRPGRGRLLRRDRYRRP